MTPIAIKKRRKKNMESLEPSSIPSTSDLPHLEKEIQCQNLVQTLTKEDVESYLIFYSM